jgi:hypothetical protein
MAVFPVSAVEQPLGGGWVVGGQHDQARLLLGQGEDIAVKAFMAGISLSLLAARFSGPDTARLPPPRGGVSDLNHAPAD